MALPKGFPDGSLRATATQASANAFAEVSIATGVAIDSKRALVVPRMEVFRPAPEANGTYQWQLSKVSKSAIVGSPDPDVIAFGSTYQVMTTSGAVLMTDPWVMEMPVGFGIAQPTVYFSVDTAGHAAAASFHIVLRYYLQTVTQSEFYALQRC